MIYGVVVGSLELVFDWIFNAAYNRIFPGSVIAAIFSVSVFMNLIALPLYSVADKIQQRERDVEKGLEHWASHIKRTFKGDERFMMLSEYYRQNHYHPIYALRSALSILIQIPFFIAAYHFLRTSPLLNGASFALFKDLGKPDALLFLNLGRFSLHLNVLPIAMTLINCASGAMYSRDFPSREKLQIYLLAAIFLVILYNSPSGLVLYWILNNVFSLVKNLFKKPRLMLVVLRVSLCVCLLVFAHGYTFHPGENKLMLLVLCATFFIWILLFFPYIARLFGEEFYKKVSRPAVIAQKQFSDFKRRFGARLETLCGHFRPNFALLLFSGLGLSLLCGFVLPSNVIATSPIEFSFLGNTPSPFAYITHASIVCFGYFVFYPVALYSLFGKKMRAVLPVLMLSLFVCALCDSYILTFDVGNIDTTFTVTNPGGFFPTKGFYILLPLELFVLTFLLVWRCQKHRKSFDVMFALVCCLGMTGIGMVNAHKIRASYTEYAQNRKKYGIEKQAPSEIEPVYHLSKTGRNVLVLFLDRGIGPYVKEIFDNYPAIKKQFDGFVYYPNTVSFSTFTITGAPPLYGGYEYAPERMNERANEELRVKNTESQLVLPKIFMDGGYSATMTDPVWPNYRWSGDLTPYEQLPGFTVKAMEGLYYNQFLEEKNLLQYLDSAVGASDDEGCKRQIINFSFIQILYPRLRGVFYNSVRYPKNGQLWLKSFSHLYFLPRLTDFDCDSDKGAYISIHSLAAHNVDTPADDFETPSANPLSDITEIHHKVNIACLRQFGKYFDYLRENGCYNNTRIIIVSDHGCNDSEEKQYARFQKGYFASGYSAMLLAKDFDSDFEVKTDEAFMTNADVPLLAIEGMGLSDTNPYTGKKLAPQKTDGVNVYACKEWNAAKFSDAYKFELDEANAWHIGNDIYREENWIPLAEWKKRNGGEN